MSATVPLLYVEYKLLTIPLSYAAVSIATTLIISMTLSSSIIGNILQYEISTFKNSKSIKT